LNQAVPSPSEIVCRDTTTTGKMASEAQPIVDCECDARIQFYREEIEKARRNLSQARGMLQRTEAMLAELLMTTR